MITGIFYKFPIFILKFLSRYTSIGGTQDTQPNPQLLHTDNISIDEKLEHKVKHFDENSRQTYLPAYFLEDYQSERQGRMKRAHSKYE